jgi:hypothetical protein
MGLRLSEKRCTNCGRILPLDAKFCLNCGSTALETVQKEAYLLKSRSGILTAGGVLTIIGSCIALVGGLIGMAISIVALPSYYYQNYQSGVALLLVISLLQIFGFAFGLTSGIQTLRRKQFAISIIRVVFLMFVGFLNFLLLSAPLVIGGLAFVLFFGVPFIVLSLLGLIFVSVRKKEFD